MISLAVIMLMMATLMVAVPLDAGTSVDGPVRAGTGDTVTFTLTVDGTASYTADIPGGSVEPDFGIVDEEAEIEVTVPNTAGRHWLTVNFTFADGSEVVREWLIDVIEPYVFTARLVNNGDIAVNGLPVKFILNGETVNVTTVDLAAGEEKTVQYRHIEGLSSGRNTITVVLDAENDLVTLSTGTTSMTTVFYIGQADYSLSHWIMGLTLVIMTFGLIWVVRKPKRNYGRPRGRR